MTIIASRPWSNLDIGEAAQLAVHKLLKTSQRMMEGTGRSKPKAITIGVNDTAVIVHCVYEDGTFFQKEEKLADLKFIPKD